MTPDDPLNTDVVEARLFLNASISSDWYIGWYRQDVPKMMDRISLLANQIAQIRRKVEKGPCGRCRL